MAIIWKAYFFLLWGFHNEIFRYSDISKIPYTELMKNQDPDPKLRARPKEVEEAIGVENISLRRDSGKLIR